MSIRILYIQPFESFGGIRFLSESFLRISNYLNSKKSELKGEIEEEYLDLRVENLPIYCPENLSNYRKSLKKLLSNIYERFRFNVVAISCYTTFSYLNTIEVGWMIRYFINPSCYIILGGFHPSVFPKDFYPENIPSYFGEYYPQNATPIDYIVIDEGEIPFFRFIRDVQIGTIKMRKNLQEKPMILETKILKSLDDLPLIDLNLFKKYKDVINKRGEFYISFNRGCLFRCKFCPPSENFMRSYRILRTKSVDKCIAEIKRIINTKWLSLKKLMINDPVLFPKKSLKKIFFYKLEKLYNEEQKLPFRIYIYDRLELCSLEDLEFYRRFNIIPGFGLETGSPTLLCRLGKFLGKNNNLQNAKEYLEKAEKLIKLSNRRNIPIVFLCMGGVPGSDEKTIKESIEFFLKKRFSGKSLIEKYKVNLQIQKFAILPGNTFYDEGEDLFSAKYFFKQWWKIFDKDQAFYSSIIRPSKHLSFLEVMNFFIDFLGKLYKAQMKLRNPFYNLSEYLFHRKLYEKCLKIYKEKISIRGRTELLQPNNNELKKQIINYLKSKGEIKAVLLHKLIKRFCHSKSKFKVKNNDLITCLFLMMKERIIDIIIPEPFQINWEMQNLRGLSFLKDGSYFVRKFSNLNNEFFISYGKNKYFFDSRALNFKNYDEILEGVNNLKVLIKKIPKIKNKMIIYYSSVSKTINIYEPFEENYMIEFLDFQIIPQFNVNSKFEIPIKQQKSDLAIIQSYRTNYMCMYITLIESIHKAIINIQKQRKNYDNYNEIVRDLTKKFGYYCYMYVKSDWIDVKPSPYRWESFFNYFDLPFKIINLTFKNIRFYGRTFEFWIRFKYCILIHRKFNEIIINFKKMGFEEFKDEIKCDYVAIGIDHEIFMPCPSIEHFYFLCKYIFFYHLFYLFNCSFPYIKKINKKISFTEKEQELYKIFLPVMKFFFNVQEHKITKKLIFNYYTYDPNELELIYNKFLLNSVKTIEKKLYNYFLIKSTK